MFGAQIPEAGFRSFSRGGRGPKGILISTKVTASTKTEIMSLFFEAINDILIGAPELI